LFTPRAVLRSAAAHRSRLLAGILPGKEPLFTSKIPLAILAAWRLSPSQADRDAEGFAAQRRVA
jgi:hypothetical protein